MPPRALKEIKPLPFAPGLHVDDVHIQAVTLADIEEMGVRRFLEPGMVVEGLKSASDLNRLESAVALSVRRGNNEIDALSPTMAMHRLGETVGRVVGRYASATALILDMDRERVSRHPNCLSTLRVAERKHGFTVVLAASTLTAKGRTGTTFLETSYMHGRPNSSPSARTFGGLVARPDIMPLDQYLDQQAEAARAAAEASQAARPINEPALRARAAAEYMMQHIYTA